MSLAKVPLVHHTLKVRGGGIIGLLIVKKAISLEPNVGLISNQGVNLIFYNVLGLSKHRTASRNTGCSKVNDISFGACSPRNWCIL